MVRDGIIYLRFDNPELDCNIRDYSLPPDYFKVIWMGCILPHGSRYVTMSVIGMTMDIGVRDILTVTVPMSGVTACKSIRRFRNV